MKKAKIMLAAIALFAVVGGALAFRAKHVGTNITLFAYTSSATSDPNKGVAGCFDPLPINQAKTTVAPAGNPVAANPVTLITNDQAVCATRTTAAGDE